MRLSYNLGIGFGVLLFLLAFPTYSQSDMMIASETILKQEGGPKENIISFVAPPAFRKIRIVLQASESNRDIGKKVKIYLNDEALNINSNAIPDVIIISSKKDYEYFRGQKRQGGKAFQARAGRNEMRVVLQGEEEMKIQVFVFGVFDPPKNKWPAESTR